MKRYPLIFIAALSLNLSLGLMPSNGAETNDNRTRELIRDASFQNGFIVLDPTPGKRVPRGVLAGFDAGRQPVWDLAQWSSRFFLVSNAVAQKTGDVLKYSNTGKAITIGRPGSLEEGIALAVYGGAEYEGGDRKSGEPWVHLLLQQDIEKPPAITEIGSARFHVEARLKNCTRKAMLHYSPGLHAAQFQIFFSIQNLNRSSGGYGKYLWFGIPLYDDRDRFPKAHKTQDTGGTSMFIFTPSGETYTSETAHSMKWITVDKDILPLIREGLETAWAQGFLKDSKNPADYRIAGMNLGWEIPGTFDAELQIRKLGLKVVAADAKDKP